MALSKKPIDPEENSKKPNSFVSPQQPVSNEQSDTSNTIPKILKPNVAPADFVPPNQKTPDFKPKERKILEINEGIAFQSKDLHQNTDKNDNVPLQPKRTRLTTGALSSEDILTKDYQTHYARMEQKVLEVVQWTQKTLSDNDKNEVISRARRERGAIYEEMSTFIDNLLVKYFATSGVVMPNQQAYVIQAVINEVLGLGPLEPLWQDGRISEIMVNGPYEIRVEIRGKIQYAPGCQFRDSEHLLQVCQQILGDAGRRVDVQKPLADGSLPDGSRINVVHPVVAPDGPYLTIRRFPDTVFTIEELIVRESMTEEMALVIGNLVYKGCSTLISGGTGTGKLLSLDTVIPTPFGKTTMGELKAGDVILDENAEPTTVTAKYSLKEPVAYELTFSDGTKVTADEDHNWFTSTRQTRRAWSRQETDVKMRDARRMPFCNDEETALIHSLYVKRTELVSPREVYNVIPKMKNVALGASKTLTVVERINGSPFYDSKEFYDYILASAVNTNDQRHKSSTEQIVTTKEIFETLKTSSGHTNHAVKMITKPVPYKEQDLLVTPYAFGAWLGDGGSASGNICGIDDEIFEAIVNEGNEINSNSYVKRTENSQLLRTTTFKNMRANLKKLGVIKTENTIGESKFIPDVYLYSSVPQRRALIAGLLDTDGTVSRTSGSVEFSNSNKAIIDGYMQIVHSLGYQTTLRSKIPTYTYKGEKKTGQRTYTVTLFTNDDVFRIQRKKVIHEELRNLKQRGHRSNLRYIVACEPVESVPMACITVDSPNSLYLVTDAFIVTHNTSMLNALSGAIPLNDRVITIEDTLELSLNPKKHVLKMVTKEAAANGEGGISIRALVKNALRMRPERIVIGEIRDESALDMMTAMTTGHEGSMTTVHANDAEGSIGRVASLIAQSGEYPIERALPLIASGIDIIVSIARYEDGSRRVSTIAEVLDHLNSDGELVPVILYEFVQDSTDEEGKLVGHYEKKNDVSTALIKKHRLDKKESLTLEELFEISKVTKPGE
jgi:Flp pilus assembly CpaF family ATPase